MGIALSEVALESFGPGAKDALPALKKLKRHPSEDIRDTVNRAIDAIGE
jgi:hypothetical protein